MKQKSVNFICRDGIVTIWFVSSAQNRIVSFGSFLAIIAWDSYHELNTFTFSFFARIFNCFAFFFHYLSNTHSSQLQSESFKSLQFDCSFHIKKIFNQWLISVGDLRNHFVCIAFVFASKSYIYYIKYK